MEVFTYTNLCPDCVKAGVNDHHLQMKLSEPDEYFCEVGHRFSELPAEVAPESLDAPDLVEADKLPEVEPLPEPVAVPDLDLGPIQAAKVAETVLQQQQAPEKVVETASELLALPFQPLPGGDALVSLVIPEFAVTDLKATAEALSPPESVEDFLQGVFVNWLRNGWYK